MGAPGSGRDGDHDRLIALQRVAGGHMAAVLAGQRCLLAAQTSCSRVGWKQGDSRVIGHRSVVPSRRSVLCRGP